MVSGPKNVHKSEKFDLIIVGYGIAARCLLREMAKEDKFHNKKILVLQSEDFFRSCSLNTTSVVCLSGVEKGISPLGDMIVDSYQVATQFYKELESDIVEKGIQISLKKDEKNSLIEEHFDAFFIHPEKLLEKIESEYKNILSLTFVNDVVGAIRNEGNNIWIEGRKYNFVSETVVVAAGAWSNFLEKDIACDDLCRSKFVSGSYLIFNDVDYGEKAFSYSYGHFNIIYRAKSHQLLIGGTTVKENIEAPSVVELHEQYSVFKELLFNRLKLPPFEKAFIKTGMRHKGRKRMPFFGEVSPGLFLMSGLYKNGFSFPFLGAKKITSSILGRL